MRPTLPNLSSRICALTWLVPLLTSACVDNATYPELQPYLPQAGLRGGPVCVPNLDGRIDAQELLPFFGNAARYRVATEVAVDVKGAAQADGVHAWDWGWTTATESVLTVAAAGLKDQWYAPEFATSGAAGLHFVAPFDLDSSLDAIYRHDSQGVWLLGLASQQAAPKAGKTLLRYEPPVLSIQFPLQVGAKWQSVGKISKGVFHGLPYAAEDTYAFSVDAAGRLFLPDLIISPALRLSTVVSVNSVLGASAKRAQVSFFFECLGEVARATSPNGTSDPQFSKAAEVRRLAL